MGTTSLTATAALLASNMRIFYWEASEGLMAENVKNGNPLSLVISIDEQVTVRTLHIAIRTCSMVVTKIPTLLHPSHHCWKRHRKTFAGTRGYRSDIKGCLSDYRSTAAHCGGCFVQCIDASLAVAGNMAAANHQTGFHLPSNTVFSSWHGFTKIDKYV